jgi:hypothetical protein
MHQNYVKISEFFFLAENSLMPNPPPSINIWFFLWVAANPATSIIPLQLVGVYKVIVTLCELHSSSSCSSGHRQTFARILLPSECRAVGERSSQALASQEVSTAILIMQTRASFKP